MRDPIQLDTDFAHIVVDPIGDHLPDCFSNMRSIH